MNAGVLHLSIDFGAAPERDAPRAATAEQALILAAQGGDSAAFGRLVQSYQKPLLRYLCRLVRRDDVSQDLCQETMLRAWRRLRDFDTSRPMAPWLYRIATNLALNFLQRRSWRWVPLLFGRQLEAKETEPDLPSDEESAEDLLLRIEDIGQIQAALERLEPSHRAPLLLYYGEELSCKELAEALDVSETAAKVRLFRARAHLKTLLQTGDSR